MRDTVNTELSNMSEQKASAPNGSARIQLTPAPSELMSVDQLDTVCLYTYSIAIPVCIFGLISNITNIIVYYKMGLSSVSNICFFCLAITDFNCVSYILVVSFVHHPRLEQPFLPISLNDVALISDTVYFGFSAMGSWITAIINVERSCCVVFPIKVKLIFTRRTIVWLLGGMTVYQIASGLPRNFAVHLTSLVSPINNRTFIAFDFERFKPKLYTSSVLASYSIPTFIIFIVVLCGTIFLINSFKQSRKLRDSMAGSEKSVMSNKDARLVHMVIFICIFYIVSATPLVVIFLTASVYPEFKYTNPYLENQAFSSSINIIVYFKMGSKYKEIFKQTFLRKSK